MTLRAILLGLAAAAGLNAVGYFNDLVLRQTYLVGSFLPIPVYGGLLLLVLLFNPLLGRWRFTGGEQAVVIALVLAACYVPGRGLMHYFTTFQMLPHHFVATTPTWETQHVLELVPPRMLADPTVNDGQALRTYIEGVPDGKGATGLAIIPWRAWTRSLGFWLPLLLSMKYSATRSAWPGRSIRHRS